jgi:hypothetical protein
MADGRSWSHRERFHTALIYEFAIYHRQSAIFNFARPGRLPPAQRPRPAPARRRSRTFPLRQTSRPPKRRPHQARRSIKEPEYRSRINEVKKFTFIVLIETAPRGKAAYNVGNLRATIETAKEVAAVIAKAQGRNVQIWQGWGNIMKAECIDVVSFRPVAAPSPENLRPATKSATLQPERFTGSHSEIPS